ncbi:hypothetical protein OROMI_008742 [Orobanche minor]
MHFRFMLDEEVRRQSFVKITNPDLLDVFDKPIPGGLHDPAMGPLGDGSSCKSCGQSSYHCNGHYGHIDLVSPSYNALLINTLNNLLNKTWFYCLHFRSSREEVENIFSQLKLIEKGDIIGARKLRLRQDLQDKKETDLALQDDIINREDRQGSHSSDPAFLSDNENQNENNVQASWDSFQLTEAISVVKEFLKKEEKKCVNCKCENPKIDKPTCGWFCVNGHSGADIRSNPIRSGRLDVTQSGGCEDKASSELVNASDGSWKVMEHSLTRKLAKVLLSNIALRNAHMNNSEHLTIICRWMDLQQSINMLFDIKTASKLASMSIPESYNRQPAMGYPPYFGLRLRHPQFLAHLDRNVAIREVDVTNLRGTHHGATMASVEIPTHPKKPGVSRRRLFFHAKD